MLNFTRFAPYAKLKKISEHTPDLRALLTPERIRSFQATSKETGLRLFYAMERVNAEVLEALFALAEAAKVHEQMVAMQSGSILNTTEQRQVLHTAMRDFFGSPQEPHATALAQRELDKLVAFLPQLEEFTDLVQIGIGGSSLGPQAVALGLERFYKQGKRVHFISNVDPDETAKVFRGLDLKKTVVVVVSKSGSTLETLTNEALARAKFEGAGLNSKKHFIAVTGEKSPMDDPQKYLASFYMWDYIGGRYSVTSMVGLVLLTFALGIEAVREFLRGAHLMDKEALETDPRKNLPLLAALLGIWNRNFLHHETLGVIAYSQALSRFPAHLQQLDMESNGKHIDKEGKPVSFETGPIVWGEVGTNSQHSFFQLLHQGTTVVPLEFIGFGKGQYGEDLDVQGSSSQEKLLSNLYAQMIALATGQTNSNPNKDFHGNRPSRLLFAEELTPFSLGAILAFYEHKVAFQGFIWGINSFDQEGVQLGKVLALKMIDAFKARRRGEKETYPLGEAFL